MAIIDTVHALPGELLDFLMLYPYLSPNATIILHDIGYHIGNPDRNVCQILFGFLDGDKTIPAPYDGYKMLYQNIGAIDLAPNLHLEGILRALSLKWVYMPSDADLEIFIESCARFYAPYLASIKELINLQKDYLKQDSAPKKSKKFKDKIKRIFKKIKS